MADMGPCKRPGSAGEGTETLAYRRAVPASRDQGQRSHCRHRGLSTADGVPFDRSASRTALLTARFDDPHPSSSQPKRRQSETSAVPGRRCRRKRGPENGVIARPGLGPVWERQARPGRRAHRNRAEERKRTLPQLSRYAELGKTKSRVITRHGGGHSKHEGDGGADHWRAERRDRNLSCREGEGSCDQSDKEGAELTRTGLVDR